jgi:hypothetical protein
LNENNIDKIELIFQMMVGYGVPAALVILSLMGDFTYFN